MEVECKEGYTHTHAHTNTHTHKHKHTHTTPHPHTHTHTLFTYGQRFRYKMEVECEEGMNQKYDKDHHQQQKEYCQRTENKKGVKDKALWNSIKTT